MKVKEIKINEIFIIGLVFAVMTICLWDFAKSFHRVYEAEEARLAGPRKARHHVGYSGSGYVDYQSGSRGFVEWTIDVPWTDEYLIGFRYALGGKTDRPLNVLINDAKARELPFSRTGGWDTWGEDEMKVMLEAGKNSIKAVATGKSGPNIDRMTVTRVSKGIFGLWRGKRI